MKFVSKMSNLRIVLRPGIQAQPITGTPAVPTLYVQFREGMANVDDQELIEKMQRHPAMNKDFIMVDDAATDPYKSSRLPSEPVHVISEIENGRVVGRSNAPSAPAQLSPQMQKAIDARAKEIAMAMLPELLKAIQTQTAEPDIAAPEDSDTEDVPETTTQKKRVTAKK